MIWRVLFVSLLMVGGTFGLFIWERMHGADIETARTVAVNALVVAEIFYLSTCAFVCTGVEPGGSVRQPLCADRRRTGQLLPDPLYLSSSVHAAGVLHRGLDAEAWLRIVAFGAILFLAVEAEKWVLRVMALRRGPS